MGIIKDMVDSIKDIAQLAKDTNTISKPSIQSLSKEASHGTLQFPVLISRSLDIETAQMVSKSLEKEFASFVQVVLSMNSIFSTDHLSAPSIKEFIRQFHQNMDTSTGFDDLKSKMLESNIEILFDESNQSVLVTAIAEGVNGKTHSDNMNLLKDPMSDLNLNLVNDSVRSQKEYFINSDKVSESFIEKYVPVSEASPRNQTNGALTKKPGTAIETPKDVLKWTQSQKLNELVPTHLVVKVKMYKDRIPTDVEFVIGVKATLHPVDSDEVITNTVAACKNSSKIFNFIKWTTGEISFFKDFLFNLGEIKDDVVNRSKGASSWWIALKRRKLLSKAKKFLFIPNSILPNTTLVLSMEEISYIKSEFGFDLLDTRFMSNVMSTYFLLGFVIVDNSTQVVHIMFDGQQNYHTYTFSAMQKEADSKEDLKQMMKIINRI